MAFVLVLLVLDLVEGVLVGGAVLVIVELACVGLPKSTLALSPLDPVAIRTRLVLPLVFVLLLLLLLMLLLLEVLRFSLDLDFVDDVVENTSKSLAMACASLEKDCTF